jgi:hypothetical protein
MLQEIVQGPWLLYSLIFILSVLIFFYKGIGEGDYTFTYGPVKGYDPYRVEPKPVCKPCPGQNGVWKYA